MFVQACMLSRSRRVSLWIITCQAPLFMRFSRQEYWTGLPCPSPGDLLDPGIEPASPVSSASQVDSLPLSHHGSPPRDVWASLISQSLINWSSCLHFPLGQITSRSLYLFGSSVSSFKIRILDSISLKFLPIPALYNFAYSTNKMKHGSSFLKINKLKMGFQECWMTQAKLRVYYCYYIYIKTSPWH